MSAYVLRYMRPNITTVEVAIIAAKFGYGLIGV